MVALPSGGLLYGERTTGIVRRLDAQGRRMPGVVARVAVSTRGQRGLLGLALDRRGRLFAAWTRPDLRLVVARLAPGRQRLVWSGPRSSDLGVGGHIVSDTDDTLLIGVGDLQAPGRSLDRSEPNGKLLALAPDGPSTQRPRVLSGGWTNPFAFDVTPAGAVWVADNAVRELPERLARGDLGFRPTRVSALPPATAPSGLATLSERELVVCGYVSRRLQRYRVDERVEPCVPARRWPPTAPWEWCAWPTGLWPTRDRKALASSTRGAERYFGDRGWRQAKICSRQTRQTLAVAPLGRGAHPRGAGLLARAVVAVQGAALDRLVDRAHQLAVSVGAGGVVGALGVLQAPEQRLDAGRAAAVLAPLALGAQDALLLGMDVGHDRRKPRPDHLPGAAALL